MHIRSDANLWNWSLGIASSRVQCSKPVIDNFFLTFRCISYFWCRFLTYLFEHTVHFATVIPWDHWLVPIGRKIRRITACRELRIQEGREVRTTDLWRSILVLSSALMTPWQTKAVCPDPFNRGCPITSLYRLNPWSNRPGSRCTPGDWVKCRVYNVFRVMSPFILNYPCSLVQHETYLLMNA